MHMGKRIVAIMLSILFCIAGTASAEVKDFHGTGEYTMSKYETPAVAEERAVQEAERDALEQAGVYVESYTKTENMQVKKDTITVLTNGILKITKRDITTTTTPTGGIRVKYYWPRENRDLQKTLEELNKLFEIDSTYPGLYADRAMVERSLGQYKNAIQDYTIAITLRGDNPTMSDMYLHDRAEIYREIGNDAKAIEDYSTYLEKHPDEWWDYQSRGWAYFRLKQYDKAIADAEAGIAAFLTRDESKDDVLNRPLFSNLHVLKADSLQAQGKYQEAIEWYTKSIEYADKALALNPNNKDAQLWKKKSLEALGRW